jgi:hypothetical protein
VQSHTSKCVFDYMHLEVWGLVEVSSIEGAYYFVGFIDNFSTKVCVYFKKYKSEVYTMFKQ